MAKIELRKRLKNFTDISLAFEPNPITGDLTVLKNERAINNSIKNIILTVPGEVPFDSTMGSQVSDYLFELFDAGTAGLLTLEVERAVKFNEPRAEIECVVVTPQPDQNQFFVAVRYKIVGYEEIFEVSQILTPTGR